MAAWAPLVLASDALLQCSSQPRDSSLLCRLTSRLYLYNLLPPVSQGAPLFTGKEPDLLVRRYCGAHFSSHTPGEDLGTGINSFFTTATSTRGAENLSGRRARRQKKEGKRQRANRLSSNALVLS